ncbi:uncharacterized protein K489DRAFT_408564 [Dissoconium aciculare CBS 342.82]|uniref:CFEM domain-containing protein n=1 Tax=Dissoconium aciculare CBS 342.82 TaxID=1314786 RepID=A0A6J3M946_9PEZI|nr:uncharacterized protein K489DRAFT_408564 [Dissoconium aciculare CBS 342.82]KAF1824139.1 hypothetical protein K489DRAFT_408564 [Dissoconium aciculare CBS 342.82]
MRVNIVFLAALFATRTVSQIVGLPACSQSCIGGFAGCQNGDVNCICSNKPLIDDLACCVSKRCNTADQAAVIAFAKLICKGSKVTDLPQTATCAADAGRASNATLSTTSTSAPAATSASVVATTSAASPAQTGAAPLYAGERVHSS